MTCKEAKSVVRRLAMGNGVEKTASAYEVGFCKYAESQGVDPKFLARFILSKQAQAASGGAGFWDSVRGWIDQFKEWYGKQEGTTKALVGGAGGALLGGALGGLFNRAGTGALLGGLGGAGAALGFDAYGNPRLNEDQLAAIKETGRRSVKKYM